MAGAVSADRPGRHRPYLRRGDPGELTIGKGGIAYLLAAEYGLELPRRLQIDFARHVQAHTDESGAEVTAAELFELFEAAYLDHGGPVQLKDWHTGGDGAAAATDLTLVCDGRTATSSHRGIGPVDALRAALEEIGHSVEVLSLTQQSIGSTAVSYLEYRSAGRTGWACGRSDSVLAASMAAVLRAVNVP